MKFIKIKGKDFEMQDAPVTQSEYEKIMKVNLSYFKRKNNPVETVSYNDCQEFIKKLNENQTKYTYRLPTEEEWEYCAKSCDLQKINEISWNIENSNGKTHPVKQKKPNDLGLYDMLGNVWEWTSTKSGSYRVLRGGSWYYDPQFLRAAYRFYDYPAYRSNDVGFRLLRISKSSPFNTFTLDKTEEALKVATEALKKIEELLK